MTLRPATPHDTDALAELGHRAFIAKFGHLYSPPNLASFLADTHSPGAVAHDLANPNLAIAVIETNGAIAAFCKVAFASTLAHHSDAHNPFELKQLYTDPDLIGRGHGAQLMEWAFAQARTAGADALQLSVYADNPQAHRFYQRYGLVKIADITFRVGDHVDPEWLMAVKL